jgi:hypothetical protein
MKTRRAFLTGAGAGLSALLLPGVSRAFGGRHRRCQPQCPPHRCCRPTWDGCTAICPEIYLGETNGLYYYQGRCKANTCTLPYYNGCSGTYIQPGGCGPDCIGISANLVLAGERCETCGSCSCSRRMPTLTSCSPFFYLGDFPTIGEDSIDNPSSPVPDKKDFKLIDGTVVKPNGKSIRDIQYHSSLDGNYHKVLIYALPKSVFPSVGTQPDAQMDLYIGHQHSGSKPDPYANLDIWNVDFESATSYLLMLIDPNSGICYFAVKPNN